MDLPCVLTVIFRITADVLRIARIWKQGGMTDASYSYDYMKELNPIYIQGRFQDSAESQNHLTMWAALFSALSWFFLCIPILQITWFLSGGGKKRVASHAVIAILVVIGSFTELISFLMITGANSVMYWMASDFDLSFGGSDADGTGWRVLEMISLCVNGMTMWIDATEWLCLFGILTLIFFSVSSENKSAQEGNATFGDKWATLGLTIGFLGIFEFACELLRLWNWMLFAQIGMILSIINLIFLLPLG